MKAIYAIDPGNATGVARGVFDTSSKTVEEAIKSGVGVSSFSLNHRARRQGQKVLVDTLDDVVGNVPYSDMYQAQILYAEFRRWKQLIVLDTKVEPDDVELVIEDFILMPGPHAGGKDGISPVRVAWAIAGIQQGIAISNRHHHISPIIWQPPSKQGQVSDERLKKLGLWVPGRDHERSAMKHLVARLSTLLR